MPFVEVFAPCFRTLFKSFLFRRDKIVAVRRATLAEDSTCFCSGGWRRAVRFRVERERRCSLRDASSSLLFPRERRSFVLCGSRRCYFLSLLSISGWISSALAAVAGRAGGRCPSWAHFLVRVRVRVEKDEGYYKPRLVIALGGYLRGC